MGMLTWSEKYAPKDLNEFVFMKDADKKRVQHWIKTKNMPHCLFYGYTGTGKTTLASLLPGLLMADNEESVFGHSAFDELLLNASADLTISAIRTSIQNFIQCTRTTRFIIIDEADELRKATQKALMGLITNEGKFARFIVICNDANKLNAALHSRLTGGTICFNTPDKDGFYYRMGEILVAENIQFDLKDLEAVQDCFYPRLRSAIDQLEQWSITGKLEIPS